MKALELAKQIESTGLQEVSFVRRLGEYDCYAPQAASELRRLAEVNTELLGALEGALKTIKSLQDAMTGPFFQEQIDGINSTIAKAKEQQ